MANPLLPSLDDTNLLEWSAKVRQSQLSFTMFTVLRRGKRVVHRWRSYLRNSETYCLGDVEVRPVVWLCSQYTSGLLGENWLFTTGTPLSNGGIVRESTHFLICTWPSAKASVPERLW